jgi:hypothetical protein
VRAGRQNGERRGLTCMPRCRSGGAPLHLPVVPSSRKPFLVHRPVIKEQTYRDGMLGRLASASTFLSFRFTHSHDWDLFPLILRAYREFVFCSLIELLLVR